MPSCRVTCRSFSSLGRNKCVHPSILPCNNPFRLICSNVACSGSRYPMNSRSVCTLFYHRALHVDESARFPLVHTSLVSGRERRGGGGDVRGGGCRQTPLFFREKRINKYIYIYTYTRDHPHDSLDSLYSRKREIRVGRF